MTLKKANPKPKTAARPDQAKKAEGVVKIHHRQTKRFVEADTIDILKMYHKEGKSLAEIGRIYKTTRQRISQIIKGTVVKVSTKGTMTLYDPAEVKTRVTLDPFERAKRLSDDAMQSCEISIHLIKHELTCLQNSIAGGGSLKDMGIDTERFIDKLTKFFQATAPYSIDRKDGKKVDDSTPDSQLHKFMEKSLPLRKV